jgi:O-antigen/teichoic acid export membrane protein
MAVDFDRKKRLRASLFYSGSAVFSQVLRLLGALFTTSRIDKPEFATFATALMLVGFCNMVRDLGQDPALISLPILRKGFIRCHLLMSSGLGIVAAGILSLTVWYTPWFGDLRPVYVFLPALILIEAGYHTAQIVCFRRYRFAAISGIEIMSATCWLAVAVVMTSRQPSVYCLLGATLAEFLCRGCGLCIVAWPDLGPARIRWAVVRYFLRYSKFLTAQSWIQHWAEHVDVLLLRILGGWRELGAYAQMQQVLGVTFSLSVRSLDQVANAAYSSDQRKPYALRRSVLLFGCLMLGSCLIALTTIYLFVSIFGPTAFGLKWKNDILDLWWWALPLCLVRPLMWNFMISFESTSRPSLLLSSVIANTFLTIFLGTLLVIPFGARGLYVALGMSQLVTVLLQIRWSKELRVCPEKLIPPAAKPRTATSAATPNQPAAVVETTV